MCYKGHEGKTEDRSTGYDWDDDPDLYRIRSNLGVCSSMFTCCSHCSSKNF